MWLDRESRPNWLEIQFAAAGYCMTKYIVTAWCSPTQETKTNNQLVFFPQSLLGLVNLIQLRVNGMYCLPFSVAFRPRFPIMRLVDVPSLNHVRVIDEVQLSCANFRLCLAAVLTCDLGIRRDDCWKQFGLVQSVPQRSLIDPLPTNFRHWRQRRFSLLFNL